MSDSRRQFVGSAALALLAASAACRKEPSGSVEPQPGSPPAFGTAPAAGPEISASTLAEAEKLVQVEMTPPERETAAKSWRTTMGALYERRTGPRKVPLEPEAAPATFK